MNSHEWKRVYRIIKLMDRRIPNARRKCPYSDGLIVAMYRRRLPLDVDETRELRG